MNKPEPSSPSLSGDRERIGDILRRARESRSLPIETLAKELKMNPRYLQALEANDYDQLPGDTYIRVYLRSLCVYLSLNPEQILRRFFDERGLTGVDTLRKDSSTKLNLSTVQSKEKPGPMLYIILALIMVLVAFSFIANKQGWFASRPSDGESDEGTQQASAAIARDSAMQQHIVPEIIPRAKTAVKKTPADTAPQKPSSRAVIKDTVLKSKEGAIKTVKKDSFAPLAAAVKKITDSILLVNDHRAAKDSPPINPNPVKDTSQKAKTSELKPAGKDTAKSATKPAKDTAAQKAVSVPEKKDSLKKDSLKSLPGSNQPKKEPAKLPASAVDSVKKTANLSPQDTAKSPATEPPGPKAMKLRITGLNDSTWAIVSRDGIRSRNMFRKGRTMYFIAYDSFSVNIAVNENTTVTLDGNPLTIPGSGEVSFKINHAGEVTVLH